MKLGTENKTKTILAVVLVVFAIFMLVRTFSGGGKSTGSTFQHCLGGRPGSCCKQRAVCAKAQAGS